MKWFAQHSKAIASALAAGVLAYLQVRDGGVTSGELAEILGAAAAAGGVTWLAPKNVEPEEAVA